MRVLILEDDHERHEIFREKLIGTVCVIVETVEQAIQKLQEEQWDLLFLDHDLGGKVYVDSSEPDTGYQVAKWLEANPSCQPGRIILHTLNGPGAKNILQCLPHAEHLPFAWKHIRVDNIQG